MLTSIWFSSIDSLVLIYNSSFFWFPYECDTRLPGREMKWLKILINELKDIALRLGNTRWICHTFITNSIDHINDDVLCRLLRLRLNSTRRRWRSWTSRLENWSSLEELAWYSPASHHSILSGDSWHLNYHSTHHPLVTHRNSHLPATCRSDNSLALKALDYWTYKPWKLKGFFNLKCT